MPKFGKESQTNLAECHQDIQKVLNEAIKYFDFTVLCGYRGKEEQDKAFKDGFSSVKFPDGKHNQKPSFAADCVPYPIDWKDTARFYFMAGVITTIAKQMNIQLEWGGFWKKKPDCPHFELKK